MNGPATHKKWKATAPSEKTGSLFSAAGRILPVHFTGNKRLSSGTRPLPESPRLNKQQSLWHASQPSRRFHSRGSTCGQDRFHCSLRWRQLHQLPGAERHKTHGGQGHSGAHGEAGPTAKRGPQRTLRTATGGGARSSAATLQRWRGPTAL